MKHCSISVICFNCLVVEEEGVQEMSRESIFGTLLLVGMLTAAFTIQPITSEVAPLGLYVNIEPEHPTVHDQVNVTVIVPDVPSISYGIDFGPLIRVDDEFSVDINISVPWILLWVYVGNVTHTYELGNLSEGSYDFSATVHYWYQLSNGTWPSSPSDYSYGKSFVVSSSSWPGLRIEPTWSYAKGQVATVDVRIFAAYNLAAIDQSIDAIEFKIRYDPLVLDPTSVIEGEFMKSLGSDTSFTFSKEYENGDSWLHVFIISIPGVVPPSAPPTTGTLATIEFFVVPSPGWTSLDLRCEAAYCIGGWICLDEAAKTDLNGDGTVNILDLAVFGSSFGSHRGQDRWNSQADIDEDGAISILDGAKIARQWEKTFEPRPEAPIPLPPILPEPPIL